MPNNKGDDTGNPFAKILSEPTTKRDQQIEELQEALAGERDARQEERFIFIVIGTILLDVVFFSVLDGLGGPLALLILELLILIPLARRMGMQEIAQMLDRILNRVTGNLKEKDNGDSG